MARRVLPALAAGLNILALLANTSLAQAQSFEYRYAKVPLAAGTPVDPGDPEEPIPGGACLTPWGDELASGENVAAFVVAEAQTQAECLSQTRTCSNGVLSGSYANPICAVDDPAAEPDPIVFASITGIEPYEWRRSSIERVSGINQPVPVAISGQNSRFRICVDADCLNEIRNFSSKATQVAPGQYVQIERRSATTYGADEISTLIVGQISASFTVSTRPGLSCDVNGHPLEHGEAWDFFTHTLHASCSSVMQNRACTDGVISGSAFYDKAYCELVDQDKVPDAIAFQSLSDLASGVDVESETVTLGGFDWRLPISVTRLESTVGQYSLCRAGRECSDQASWTNWTQGRMSVEPGDSLRLKLRSSGKVQTVSSLNVTIGDLTTSWDISTRLGLACEAPWGGEVPHGQGITAYGAETVEFGISCPTETRTCDDGTLGGSFIHQACTINAQDDQPDQFTIADLVGLEPGGNYYSDYIQATGFTGSLPISISGGENTAFRVCTGPTSGTCGTLNTLPKEIAVGQYFQVRQRSGDFGTTATLNVQLGPVASAWNISSRPALSCSTPWGETLAHGVTVPVYRTESVPYGQQCIVSDRTCTDGVFTGSTINQYPACVVEEQVVDIQPFPMGESTDLNPGQTAFSTRALLTGFTGSTSVSFSKTGTTTVSVRICTSASCPGSGWGTWSTVSNPRTFQSGTWLEFRTIVPSFGQSNDLTVTALGRSEQFNVRPRDAQSCVSPWGTPVEHGIAVTAYLDPAPVYGDFCRSSGRACNDGSLGGNSTYVNETCTVDDTPRPDPFAFADTTAAAGGSVYVRSGTIRLTGTLGNIPITVTGDGQMNRNANTSCSTGSWVTPGTTTMATNAFLCFRAYPGATPGEVKTFTVTIGDQSATWNLIAQ